MSRARGIALALTMGDPCGIGPEILVKALARPDLAGRDGRLVVVGDARVIDREARRQRIRLRLPAFRDEGGAQSLPGVSLVDASSLDPGTLAPGAPCTEGAAASLEYVRAAVSLALRGTVGGIVTLPVGKAGIRSVEPAFTGHTEWLRDMAGVRQVLMCMCAGRFRVALATTHLPFAEVPASLTTAGLGAALRLLHEGLDADFGIGSPRIGVAALNPHGGEGGAFGDEEARVIAPAIAEAQEDGVDAAGPIPADTLFPRLAAGEFDAALALYHDQGMIPVKLVHFGRAANLTLGLPFVRTSPAHGTAWGIAGRGEASEESLVAAIRLAARLVRRRATRRGGPAAP